LGSSQNGKFVIYNNKSLYTFDLSKGTKNFKLSDEVTFKSLLEEVGGNYPYIE
jgi:hypothetical protein